MGQHECPEANNSRGMASSCWPLQGLGQLVSALQCRQDDAGDVLVGLSSSYPPAGVAFAQSYNIPNCHRHVRVGFLLYSMFTVRATQFGMHQINYVNQAERDKPGFWDALRYATWKPDGILPGLAAYLLVALVAFLAWLNAGEPKYAEALTSDRFTSMMPGLTGARDSSWIVESMNLAEDADRVDVIVAEPSTGWRWLIRAVPSTMRLVSAVTLGPRPELGPQSPPSLQDVQARLGQLGYSAGPVDGLMGPRTKAALARFQSEHGIPPTGLPDGATLRALKLIPNS